MAKKRIIAGVLALTLGWLPMVMAVERTVPVAGPANSAGVITDATSVPPGSDPAVVSPPQTIPPLMQVRAGVLNTPAGTSQPTDSARQPTTPPPAANDAQYIGSDTEFSRDMQRIRNGTVSSAGAIIRAQYVTRLNRILDEMTAGTLDPLRAIHLTRRIIDRCNLMRDLDNRLRPKNYRVNTNALTQVFRIDTRILEEAIRKAQQMTGSGNGGTRSANASSNEMSSKDTFPVNYTDPPPANNPDQPPGPGTGNADILAGIREELEALHEEARSIIIAMRTQVAGVTLANQLIELTNIWKRVADLQLELVMLRVPPPTAQEIRAARIANLREKIQQNTIAINQLTRWINAHPNRGEYRQLRARLRQERGRFQNQLDTLLRN